MLPHHLGDSCPTPSLPLTTEVWLLPGAAIASPQLPPMRVPTSDWGPFPCSYPRQATSPSARSSRNALRLQQGSSTLLCQRLAPLSPS